MDGDMIPNANTKLVFPLSRFDNAKSNVKNVYDKKDNFNPGRQLFRICTRFITDDPTMH